MPGAGRFFNFLVNSNLFIAACAVLMARHTSLLLLHTEPSHYFLAFIFLATICSYSFHWYLSSEPAPPSPRMNWLQRNQNIYLILFIIGLAGSVFFFFDLLKYWPWLLLSAIITFLYSAPKIPNKYFRQLRKIALGKTIFLALVWTHVTTVLPLIVSDQPWRIDFSLFALSRYFLIYAICILFDYRDREDDKTKGIRSLITYLSERGIRNLFAFSLLLFFILTICLYFYHYSLITLLVLLAPGIITATLYNYARKNFSDILYYFVLDGLMALSALLALLTGT
ncbi:MAG: UbiA family prenyltransferase [Bacteroidota bacterium]|nr:UbiA family prenyltransferase [Bacteroidota bacterium]